MKTSGNMAMDKVTNYIKDSIMSGKWTSGDRLPTEQELCEQVGVSRSGAREAMKVLEASHIVEIRRGDGTYLSDPDKISFMGPLLFKIILNSNTLQELYDFRESIEMAVMRLAICNADENDFRDLERCNQEMQDYIDQNKSDVWELYQLDLDFHKRLAEATHNAIMRDVYLFTFDVFAPFIRQNYEKGQKAESALTTHIDTLNALKTGDILQVGYTIRTSVGLWRAWIGRKDAKNIVLADLWKTSRFTLDPTPNHAVDPASSEEDLHDLTSE
jgi:GntR family transcriptional repressor for pyruvate dehydrogenase complex